MGRRIEWAYAVTTVPSRRSDLLPKTLETLAAGGFRDPLLFVDNLHCSEAFNTRALSVVRRWPEIGAAGNWILGLYELFIRHPDATHFAMFQDDITMCVGVREYIESTWRPKQHRKESYLNLCTYPQNEELAEGHEGWVQSNQRGFGAQALVFSKQSVLCLLSSRVPLEKFQVGRNADRSIDGRVSVALKKEKIKEFVHYPSLVDHIGFDSTMAGKAPQPRIKCFRGCDYDVRSLCEANA